MCHSLKTKFVVLAFVSVCLLGGTASAGCGDSNKLGALLHRQSWQGANSSQPGSLLTIAEDHDPIVGMWHATFTAQGNEVGPPDGVQIDNALVTWHSDGTELMNSARPPQDGDFCMGVWKKTGRNSYKLNHIPWLGNDTANAPSGIGNPAGPTRIFEEVTLSPDGKHYTGKFTLDAYDTLGNQVAHIVGNIAATRITLSTTVVCCSRSLCIMQGGFFTRSALQRIAFFLAAEFACPDERVQAYSSEIRSLRKDSVKVSKLIPDNYGPGDFLLLSWRKAALEQRRSERGALFYGSANSQTVVSALCNARVFR